MGSRTAPNCWQPGDPLTEKDEALIAPLKAFYAAHGYTPVQREIPAAGTIKQRFRTWGMAVRAAGLPWVNYPEQQRLRIAAQGSGATDTITTEES